MAKAYAHKFARVTLWGTMHQGNEEWSTGFQMGSPTTDITGVNAPGAENIANLWKTFWIAPANKISGWYFFRGAKVAMINVDGTTNVDEIDYYDLPTSVGGGGGSTGVLPPQVTLAATLTSDNQRGLASKGRMYLPGIQEPIEGTTGGISSAFRTTLTDNLKVFFDGVNVAPGTSGKMILASAGHKTQTLDANGQPQYLGGQSAWVTGFRVGNIYDTQRRRRNGFVESYTTKVLA